MGCVKIGTSPLSRFDVPCRGALPDGNGLGAGSVLAAFAHGTPRPYNPGNLRTQTQGLGVPGRVHSRYAITTSGYADFDTSSLMVEYICVLTAR